MEAKLTRRGTVAVGEIDATADQTLTSDVDVKVLSYTCVPEGRTTGNLGTKTKKWSWTLEVPFNQILNIAVTRDEHLISTSKMRVMINDHVQHEGPSSIDYTLPLEYPGVLRGLGENNIYQVRVPKEYMIREGIFGSLMPANMGIGVDDQAMYQEQWCDCTIMKMRTLSGGLHPHVAFDMFAHVPDVTYGVQKVTLENVELHDLRMKKDHTIVQLPKRRVNLSVKKDATDLTVDGREFWEFLTLPTPPPGLPSPLVRLELSRDRRQASADVSASVLQKMQRGQIVAKDRKVDKFSSTFVFEADGVGTHTLELCGEKKSAISVGGKQTPLTVKLDGKVLVQCLASDCSGASGGFDFSFRLLGTKKLITQVYEEDGNGRSLDTTKAVEKPMAYGHRARVWAQNEHDLSQAMLFIDDVPFNDLPMDVGNSTPACSSRDLSEPNLHAPRDVFEKTYRVEFPRALRPAKAAGLEDLKNGFMPVVDLSRQLVPKTLLARLFSCCNADVDGGNEISVLDADGNVRVGTVPQQHPQVTD